MNFHVALSIAAFVAMPFPASAQAKPDSQEGLNRIRGTAAVAYAVRPSDPSRYLPVERIELDKSLRPTTRTPVNIGCHRVHAATTGELVCLTQSLPGSPGKFTPITTYLFSPTMEKRAAFVRRTGGIPSRARISSNGEFLATTVFTSGHSYLGIAGSEFSTETIISKRGDGATAQNIQQWAISWKGQRVTSIDLNLWGVTFDYRDSDRFFVTVYFGGVPHLGEGSITKRSIEIVHSKVECPSLSPDGRRIAFKRRIDATTWQPAILDLQTMTERVLTVPNSVDDQIEWLDNNVLLYEVTTVRLMGKPRHDVYMLDISSNVPEQRLWLEDAKSPTIVRTSIS